MTAQHRIGARQTERAGLALEGDRVVIVRQAQVAAEGHQPRLRRGGAIDAGQQGAIDEVQVLARPDGGGCGRRAGRRLARTAAKSSPPSRAKRNAGVRGITTRLRCEAAGDGAPAPRVTGAVGAAAQAQRDGVLEALGGGEVDDSPR